MTGVQTCALPIFRIWFFASSSSSRSNLCQVDISGFRSAGITGSLLPVPQCRSHFQQLSSVLRIRGKVVKLPRVTFCIVEFFDWAGLCHDQVLFVRQFSSGMQFSHRLQNWLAVFIAVGLQPWAIWKAVPDVLESSVSHAANQINSFVCSIAGGEDKLSGLVAISKDILSEDPIRRSDSSESQCGSSQIDVLYGIVSHDAIAWSQLHENPDAPASLVVRTDARRREEYWSVYSGLDANGLPVRTSGPAVGAPAQIDAELAAELKRTCPGLTEDAVAHRQEHDLRGCGNALIGPLLAALLERGVEPVLGARATDLLVEDGRVIGVRLEIGRAHV